MSSSAGFLNTTMWQHLLLVKVRKVYYMTIELLKNKLLLS